MICIHCGKNIPYAEKKCPYCKQNTEFETRFHYVPEPAPIHAAESETMKTEVSSTQDTVLKDEQQYNTDIEDNKELKTESRSAIVSEKNPVPTGVIFVGIMAVLLLVILLFFAVSPGRPDSDEQSSELPVSTESDGSGEIDEQTVGGESSQEKASSIYIYFDVNLPETAYEENRLSQIGMLYIPGLKAPDLPEEVSGYACVGWCTTRDGSGQVFQAHETIPLLSEDTTLFAKWQRYETVEGSLPQNEETIPDSGNNVTEHIDTTDVEPEEADPAYQAEPGSIPA